MERRRSFDSLLVGSRCRDLKAPGRPVAGQPARQPKGGVSKWPGACFPPGAVRAQSTPLLSTLLRITLKASSGRFLVCTLLSHGRSIQGVARNVREYTRKPD